jgi:hypothetical protein
MALQATSSKKAPSGAPTSKHENLSPTSECYGCVLVAAICGNPGSLLLQTPHPHRFSAKRTEGPSSLQTRRLT